MITGFDTKQLRQDQLDCKDFIVNLFKRNKGTFMFNDHLRSWIELQKEVRFTSTEFRNIIHIIRRENLLPVIIATSKGYKYTTDQEEIQLYIDSLSDRIRTITDLKTAIEDGKARLEQAYVTTA